MIQKLQPCKVLPHNRLFRPFPTFKRAQGWFRALGKYIVTIKIILTDIALVLGSVHNFLWV